MNAKQAKRIRRNIRQAMNHVNPETGEQKSVDTDTVHIRGLVPSSRYNTMVNGEVMEGMAVQIRVAPESFRGIYLRVKSRVALRRKQPFDSGTNTNVQANRSKKRVRVLPSIQLRSSEAAGAMEHAGTEGVQRQHNNVSVL